MEVRIRHGAGKQTQAYARFHRLVCDQPFQEGGSDTGMTPPELMLSALGCCASHYAAEYLRAHHQSFDNLEIRLSAAKGERPARLVDIRIEVNAAGLSADTKEGLLRAVNACLLHRTLANPPAIAITFAPSSAGEAA
jgi:putative redox protein